MEYRVLGSLEVRDGDRSLPLAGTKQRALLALLLVNANRVVSRDRLIDGLWGEQPPETAVTSVQVYVSRLRKLLPPDTLLTRVLGGMTDLTGEHEQARAIYERSLSVFREEGDDAGAATMVFRIGAARFHAGKLHDARSLIEESLEAFTRVGDQAGECQALGFLGQIHARDGDARRARTLLQRSARLAHEIGYVWWELQILGKLAELLVSQGEPEFAEARNAEALSLAHRIHDRLHTISRLAWMALIAADRGDIERAGRLWGAIEAEESRGRIGGWWESEHEKYEQRVRSGGDPLFERAREMGRALSMDEAVDEALASLRANAVSVDTATSANRE